MGMLLSSHSAYVEVPELEFHTDAGGLMDLLAGKIELDKFLSHMEIWYYRSPPPPRPCGLHELVPRKSFDAMLAEFASAWPRAPMAASRRLILALVDPRLGASAKPSWVEATPTTTAAAATLHELVPEAKFIHMLRDGRESVVSARARGWVWAQRHGMGWWETWIRTVNDQCRRLPPDRFVAIELVDLVRDRREETYETLLDHLDLDDQPALRSFFDTRVGVESTRIGTWRSELDPDEVAQLDADYADAIDRLRRDGVTLLPRVPSEL